MSVASLTQPDAVRAAMDEFDEMGREPFLGKYGYGHAKRYFVQRDGKLYDSKAIAGVAVGYQHPERGPMLNSEFSGGEGSVVRRLEELGFELVDTGEDADPAADAGAAWIVRAGKNGEAEALALAENVVVIGWSELPDLAEAHSAEEIRELLVSVSTETREASIGQQVGQIYRFVREIEVGDVVVLPLHTSRGHVAIGRITGSYVHRDETEFAACKAAGGSGTPSARAPVGVRPIRSAA
jgi:hypothetical protein